MNFLLMSREGTLSMYSATINTSSVNYKCTNKIKNDEKLLEDSITLRV